MRGVPAGSVLKRREEKQATKCLTAPWMVEGWGPVLEFSLVVLFRSKCWLPGLGCFVGFRIGELQSQSGVERSQGQTATGHGLKLTRAGES